jgi:hypothetical protein
MKTSTPVRFVGFLLLAATTLPLRSAAAPVMVSPDSLPSPTPAVLPGRGLAQHPFLYAGGWDTRKALQSMFLVRAGKIIWPHSIPLHNATGGIQEFAAATLLSDGTIIFSCMSGAGAINQDKDIVWQYSAPPGTEVHSIQAIGKDRVLIMRNGPPAQAMIFNLATNKPEKTIPIPTVHLHFACAQNGMIKRNV